MMPARSDVRIEARVRNNVLWHAIHDTWPSVAAFCRDRNYDDSDVGDLLNTKTPPLRRSGKYRPLCLRLETEFGISCAELFPLHLYKLKHAYVVIEVPFSALPGRGREVALLAAAHTPFDTVVAYELSRNVDMVLETLQPLDALVIRLRKGLEDGTERSAAEVGEIIGKSKSWVLQIEARALQRLRSPERAKLLKPFVDP